CPFWAISSAIASDLQLTVTSPAQVHDIQSAAVQANKVAQVHVKVDSGMHRLGVSPDKVGDLLSSIYAQPALKLIGLFSHLARAEDREESARQNETFLSLIERLPPQYPRP